MALDQHVRNHLIDTGVITARGLTRTTTHRHCPRGCGLVLLACQDSGIEIWCDPLPITPAGELTALLTGRPTYTLLLGQLAYRHFDRITFRDANTDRVYAAHQCGTPQPDVNYRHIKTMQRPDHSAAPPF